MGTENDFESAFDDASREPVEGSEAATPNSENTGDDAGDAGFDREEETVTSEGEEDTGAEGEADEEPPAGEGEEDTDAEGGGEGGEEPPAGEGEEDTDAEGGGEGGEEPPAAEGDKAPQPKGALDEEALAAAYRRLREEEQADAKGDRGEDPGTQEVSPQDKSWKDYVRDEDKALVEEYEKEWSEVSRAEQIKRDAQLQHVQDVVYSNLRSVLAPIVEQVQQSKVEAHFNSIRSRVPEFDDIREPVQEWVKEQPEFMRPAFEQVLQKGSADQVVELLNAYKQATGKTGAAPEVPASSASKGKQPAAKPKRPAPSGAAKRAMAAAPSPKRSNPPAQTDPNDFSSAFDEAAAGGI